MKRLIAEFEEQSFTQIIFPHKNTDWICCLEEARKNFVNIINAIIKYQKCLVVCTDIEETKSYFEENKNLFFIEYETNDCWARDTSALSIEEDKEIKLLDFTFTGWGGKFEAEKDNLLTKSISKHYSKPIDTIDFILEGGGVESNGIDAILTTSECMLNKNRNSSLDSIQITQKLNDYFGATKIHYLDHGYLAGDDTDSHIDTLARFVDQNTIMYVEPPKNKDDEHFNELKKMEDELKVIASQNSYNLVTLPFCDPVYFEDERLPATYANFLFVNGAVLVPVYGIKQDEEALKIFEDFFTDLDIVGIDCSTLIKQHGSLHCVTMNFAKGVDITL
ncbi:agmatine deiminase family protein [Sulfurimonas sp.]|uniref:agmatine deiminase family protein n=1 Tax=Sulfurimonas sp. TaxID=2022749 RepID=UPI003563C9A5